MRRVDNGYAALDRYQQAHAWLGFPLAVRQKYADDQGGYLAATISYYGFFSVFPLLLAFTTLLGYILHAHRHLYQSVVASTLAQFPVIGDDLSVNSLHGRSLPLAIGVGASLWAGMGAFLALQNAMNQLWGVPFTRRPDFLRARVHAVLVVLLLGAGVLCATLLAGISTVGTSYGFGWRAGSIVLSTGLDVGLFWVVFRLLAPAHVHWAQLRWGAVGAAVAYELMQALGGYYIGHVVKGAGNTYGTFALVIGLLSWLYLTAQITLFAAEANVVAAKGLWPRSLSLLRELPATEADERALTQLGEMEARRHDQHIEVQVDRRDR